MEISVGILALQGDFSLHVQALRNLRVNTKLVKKPEDFRNLYGLIIPGGESSTLLYLTESFGLIDEIIKFAKNGGKILGTCAGAILLAKKVTQPKQKSLNLLDIEIERNSYGRQINSFEAVGKAVKPLPKNINMTFIRAPRITSVGKNSKILATCNDEPVLVQQNQVLVATFHPELSGGLSIYRHWLDI